jgi:hypothetical protein
VKNAQNFVKSALPLLPVLNALTMLPSQPDSLNASAIQLIDTIQLPALVKNVKITQLKALLMPKYAYARLNMSQSRENVSVRVQPTTAFHSEDARLCLLTRRKIPKMILALYAMTASTKMDKHVRVVLIYVLFVVLQLTAMVVLLTLQSQLKEYVNAILVIYNLQTLV